MKELQFPKFEHPDMSDGSPDKRLVEAWADLVYNNEVHQEEINRVSSDVNHQILFGEDSENVPDEADTSEINFSLEVEKRLAAELPSVAVAMQGLKQALDAFRGYEVQWLQMYYDEPLTEEEIPDNIYNGIVTDVYVGPNEFSQSGLLAMLWIQLSADRRPFNHDFNMMANVSFRKPTT